MNPAQARTDQPDQPARWNGERPFVIRQVLSAPRARVWKAWTDREELQRWFGPKGFTMPVCALDLRPGGTFHYCLRSGDGHVMWGKWTFREVVPQERLVLVSSFSDAQGGITTHPMSPTWPRETLSTTTFHDQGDKTELELRWLVHQGTAAEHATFDGAYDGMRQGWGGTFAQLDAYLARR